MVFGDYWIVGFSALFGFMLSALLMVDDCGD